MLASLKAWAVAHPAWSVTVGLVLLYLFTGLLNWATYPDSADEWKRIQLEEPRRAGVVLFFRGWGFYPAKTWRGIVAIVTGRLTGTSSDPPKPPKPPTGLMVFLVMVLGLSSFGCAASFEEARFVGLKTASPIAKASAERNPDEVRYCRELDDARIRSGAIAKGSAVIAGVAGAGGGVVEAVDDPRIHPAVPIGAGVVAVAAGAVAAHQFFTAEGKGAAWARDCR